MALTVVANDVVLELDLGHAHCIDKVDAAAAKVAISGTSANTRHKARLELGAISAGMRDVDTLSLDCRNDIVQD